MADIVELPAPSLRTEVHRRADAILALGLKCAIEVREPSASAHAWEPRILFLSPPALLDRVHQAIEETARLSPGAGVRLAGYTGSSLRRSGRVTPYECAPAQP